MKKMLGCLLVLLLIACCAVTSLADTNVGKLTVQVRKSDLLNDTSNITISLYQIGTAEATTGMDWRIYSVYSSAGIERVKTSSDIDKAADKVAEINRQNGLRPFTSGVTRSNGVVEFLNLDPGVYYGEMTSSNSITMKMQPFIVKVPTLEDGKVSYDVLVEPKIEVAPPKPTDTPKVTSTPYNPPTPTSQPTPKRTPRNTPNTTTTPTPTVTSTVTPTGSIGATTPPPTVDKPTPPPSYKVTVNYWVGGEPAFPPHIFTHEYGKPITIVAPPKPGYSVDTPTITQEITQDTTFNVTYTPNPYKLTVYYVFEDQTTAAPTHYEVLWTGDHFNIPSPPIPGYKVSIKVVDGTMEGHDIVKKVVYVSADKKLVDIEDLQAALGLGDIQMHVGVCYE